MMEIQNGDIGVFSLYSCNIEYVNDIISWKG